MLIVTIEKHYFQKLLKANKITTNFNFNNNNPDNFSATPLVLSISYIY